MQEGTFSFVAEIEVSRAVAYRVTVLSISGVRPHHWMSADAVNSAFGHTWPIEGASWRPPPVFTELARWALPPLACTVMLRTSVLRRSLLHRALRVRISDAIAAALAQPVEEAAVVSRVSPRDVNRAIDAHILPEAFVSHYNGRRVWTNACALIAFYCETAPRLTADERLHTIKRAEARPTKWHAAAWSKLLREDWKVRDEFLTFDLAPLMRRTAERFADLEAARAIVTANPEILRGMPVIRNTRTPVYDVAASSAAGIPTARILEAYPGLDAEQVRLAAIYAEANPQRSRPRAASALPEGVVTMTDQTVPRRRKVG